MPQWLGAFYKSIGLEEVEGMSEIANVVTKMLFTADGSINLKLVYLLCH